MRVRVRLRLIFRTAGVGVVNPDINAQDFGRKMKKTIPIEKFYTAVFFLLKQNIIFFKLMAYPWQEKAHCFLCECCLACFVIEYYFTLFQSSVVYNVHIKLSSPPKNSPFFKPILSVGPELSKFLYQLAEFPIYYTDDFGRLRSKFPIYMRFVYDVPLI